MSRKFNRRDYKDALGQGLRRIAQPKIHKNTSTARDILLKGARTLVLTYDETELLDATASRDIPRVKQLLEKGTKATCYDERLRTPLHFACAAGCLELINLLITSGAKVNSRDVNGSTPLLLAVTSGNLECVSILLAAGANLEIADARQRTPLSMAKSRLQFLKRQVEFDLPPDYEEVESDKTHLIHQITQVIRILHFYVTELKRKPQDTGSMVVVEEEDLNDLESRLVNLSVGEANENSEREIMNELSALMGKFDLL